MKTVTVVSVQDGLFVPVPVQSLVTILLEEGYSVKLIGDNLDRLPMKIKGHPNFEGFDLPQRNAKSMVGKLRYRIKLHQSVNQLVHDCMETSNYLWTTSIGCIRELGMKVTQYKNIMELLELVPCGYYYRHLFKYDLGKIARNSWKNVAVEENRAYIEKVWWDLPNTPNVLPNKPASLDYEPISEEAKAVIEKMQAEKRKIILYLGGIYSDREFEECARAISKMDGYAMYIVGRIASDESQHTIDRLVRDYSVTYLGYLKPPNHLAVVRHAWIGLLPYKPYHDGTDNSELNALYCAPNKIFEYAGFGVPMVGSDVLGLKLPFREWNIGLCCNMNDEDSVMQAIRTVDEHHDEMSKNCMPFFDSIDLHGIVADILTEKEN